MSLLWKFFTRFTSRQIERVRSTRSGTRSQSELAGTENPNEKITSSGYVPNEQQASSRATTPAPNQPHRPNNMAAPAIQSLAAVMKTAEAHHPTPPQPVDRMSSSSRLRTSLREQSSTRIAAATNNATAAPPQPTPRQQPQQEKTPKVIFTGYSQVDARSQQPCPIVTPYEVPVSTKTSTDDDVILSSYDTVTDTSSPVVYSKPIARQARGK